MSLSKKIFLFFLLVVFLTPYLGYKYYRHVHPKYIPPTPRQEINITIIPGWNLRQVAQELVDNKLIKTPGELYAVVGNPATVYGGKNKPPILNFVDASGTAQFPLLTTKSDSVSYEGYFYPDTYRVYADATIEEILEKIFGNLENKITPEIRDQIRVSGKSFFEILTMASIVQKEAPSNQEMGMVADIFLRRLDKHWALQSCATVNYVTGKNDPGVTGYDKNIESLYNTYRNAGLPIGPISNPSINAIKAVLKPIKNDYWYFMAGTDGVTRYAKTLDQHNANVAKYLR